VGPLTAPEVPVTIDLHAMPACGRLTLGILCRVLAAACTVPAPGMAQEIRGLPASEKASIAVLTVREPFGVARARWPVGTGVPFPRGSLQGPGGVWVKEVDGAAFPAQGRVLSRWQDGSVRWLLLDFPANLTAHETKRFEISLAGAVKDSPGPQVRVAEGAEGIAVDTGPLRFVVSRKHGEILSAVSLNGQPALAGPVTAILHPDGEPARAETKSAATTETRSAITIKERGPLRCQIEARGPLTAGFDYVVRIHAFAGQPFVRVFFTFIATGPAPMTAVRQLAVQLPTRMTEAVRYRLGVEGRTAAPRALAKKGVILTQEDNTRFRLDGKSETGRALGWIEAAGPAGGVAVAARFFWQEYAKGFQLQPDLLTYSLWPPEVAPVQVGVGAAKTHEFSLFFFERLPPDGLTAALAQPLIASLEPSTVARTKALPNAIAPEPSAESFLRRLNAAHPQMLARNDKEPWDDGQQVECPPSGKERRRVGAYGMLNWGDWNYPGFHDSTKGCDAWGNLEYDLAQVAALAFAATGDVAYHQTMTVAARHFMDVDVIHTHPAYPKWVGMNHPKNPLHFTFARGGVDLGHTWTEGLLSYYYWTGDDRALEVARGIADYLERRFRAGIFAGNPRQWGWPQIALVAVYEATGEVGYKDAALAYARRGIEAHKPQATNDWKLGILADALVDTHRVTHDPDIERWLRAYASSLAGKPQGDLRLYPALPYVTTLSGDTRLAGAARRVLDAIEFGSWAKPFTIAGRTGFRILSLLGTDAASPAPAGETTPLTRQTPP
jgi:hypothetical protein